jgi:hypothetical protein
MKFISVVRTTFGDFPIGSSRTEECSGFEVRVGAGGDAGVGGRGGGGGSEDREGEGGGEEGEGGEESHLEDGR